MNNADLFDLFGAPGDEPPKAEGEAPTRFLPPNPAPPAVAPGLLPGQPAASGLEPAPLPTPDLFGASGLTGFSPLPPAAQTKPKARPAAPPAKAAPNLPLLPDLPALPDLLALPELPPLPTLPGMPEVPEVPVPGPAQAPAAPVPGQVGARPAATPSQAAGAADALRRESPQPQPRHQTLAAASAARQPSPPTAPAVQPAAIDNGAARAQPPAPPQAPAHVPPLVGVETDEDTAEDGDDFWSGPPITPLPQPVFSPKAAPGPRPGAVPMPTAQHAPPGPAATSAAMQAADEHAPQSDALATAAPAATPSAPATAPARRVLPPAPQAAPVASRHRPAVPPAPAQAPQTQRDGEWSDWPPMDASDDWSPLNGDGGDADSWIDELPPPTAADWDEAHEPWPSDGDPVWDDAGQFDVPLAEEPTGPAGAVARAGSDEVGAQAQAKAPKDLPAPASPPAPASAQTRDQAAAGGRLRGPSPLAPQATPRQSEVAAVPAVQPVASTVSKPATQPLSTEALAAIGELPAADLTHPQAQAHLRQHLRAWVASDQLRELDLALADFLLALAPQMSPLALLGAVLASHQLGRGHVCLDLGAALGSGARTLAWRRLPAPVGMQAVSGDILLISGGNLAILGHADPGTDPAAVLAVQPAGAPQAGDAPPAPPDPAQPGAVLPPTGIEAVDTTASEPAMLPTPMDWLAGVSLPQWQAELLACAQVLPAAGASPLVLQGARLYLRRQWQDEHSVRAAIVARVGQAAQLRQRWAPARWQGALKALFDAPAAGKPQSTGMDWQRAACALAASQGFCIITGGPGTGKTTTVVKLLALLQAMALAPRDDQGAADEGAAPSTGQPLRIALAAPTGKAAARLGESISGALKQLQLGNLAQVLAVPGLTPPSGATERAPTSLTGAERLMAAIPREAVTLHRLLGPRADSRHFWHHAHNPLPVDVLVVDEASMVDLDMMARLMAALPPGARLVLLGDKDQLASVEAGAVLGELCSRAQHGHFNPATVDWLQAVTGMSVPPALCDEGGTPLDQAVVMLRHSHRFAGQSGIGQLAKAVNAGQVRAVARLRLQPPDDLQWLAVANAQAPELAQLLLEGQLSGQPSSTELDEHGRLRERQGYAHYLREMHAGMAALQPGMGAGEPLDEAALSAWALRVLVAHRRFQLLCALREGPWGVSGLNRRIARVLAGAGLIAPQGSWWAGRPVMVTGNDYGLGLMNGDIGVTLQRPDRLAVAFADPARPGGVRWVAPSRLAQVETVFAMTVHKSQGSEFAHTALAIPPQWNPVLTRELVYTGITRASQWCAIVLAGDKGDAVLDMAVKRRVLRASGLLADV